MASRYPNLIIEARGGVALITLNRPEKLNALDGTLMESLGRAVADIGKDNGYKAIVISGAGNRAFCAGADIAHISKLKTRKDAAGFVNAAHSLMDKIAKVRKPVIAAIDGYCLGGGCELALACDIRIASTKAMFGLPEVTLGILPGGGGTQRLPEAVGLSKAKELIFTGKIIDAKEALSIHLVDKVTSGDKLIGEALSLAKLITKNSGNAVGSAKSAINAGVRSDYSAERDAFVAAVLHHDGKEGLKAFLEHRKPDFD
jgi:enoyl-CoA hydratase